METTECPTALERDLNPPNTSRCPLQPLSWWDPPLYSSFSRKFALLFFLFFFSHPLIRCTSWFFHTRGGERGGPWISQAAPAGATLSRRVLPLCCDLCCGIWIRRGGGISAEITEILQLRRGEKTSTQTDEFREAVILRETASQPAHTHFSLKKKKMPQALVKMVALPLRGSNATRPAAICVPSKIIQLPPRGLTCC